MNSYTNIEEKLYRFIRKYYTNELIKGGILFFSFGILYLFFTLFIEYFLWLQPTARTFLFFLFVIVEFLLLIRFIFIPIFKLMGLRKGISLTESSKIIGNHFAEVQDKLLNILQLKEQANQNDLILAGIEQKANELQPIPFLKAIDFKKNTHYLKYALIPVFIWLISLLTGINEAITQSLERIVNYKTTYNMPAPFVFLLQNKSLEGIQGKPFTIHFKTKGNVRPETIKIMFQNQQYYLQNKRDGIFSYTFSEINKDLNFYVEANNIQSKNYTIKVIKTPIIKNIAMRLVYPKYTSKKNEVIKNTGNSSVPEGTKVIWSVLANQSDSIAFIYQKKRYNFRQTRLDNFSFSKKITQNINYQITSSNKNLNDYENLAFSIKSIKDEYPRIIVKSNIDSLSFKIAQFAGQISDDYGLKKLQIIYYDEKKPQAQKKIDLKITKESIQTFYYEFPKELNLEEGINYELFFQVFDNDGVNGSKKTISRKFKYRRKTEEEINDELLQEQQKNLYNLENTIQDQKNQNQKLKNLEQDLQNKKKIQWNDKKKVHDFIKRQEQYTQMMQRQTEKLQENLSEKKEDNQYLQNKKEELKKRIEELKKLDQKQKLLDEIEKMARKLNKEDLLKKAKELTQKNKQEARSLERILELTKRFYVEQKTMQIALKLERLSKKQDSLQKATETILEQQEDIKKKFNKIENEIEELKKENEKLKKPMELPETDEEQKDVNKSLNKVEKDLTKKKEIEAKKEQKKTAKKMQKMSQKIEQQMMNMQGESIEEDRENLRKILENLITFSFKQEELITFFDAISTGHPDFGKGLKSQNEIKTYFEHIDDSLYVLSLRIPKISTKIQEDLSSAHYNLQQSLENFSEGKFSNGTANQQYVMTAVNSLADYLSNILNSMKNSTLSKSGKGNGKSFSLPDLIKKQEGLTEKMKKGMKSREEKKERDGGKERKSGQKKGQENGENEKLDEELYQVYKEQSELRMLLEQAIKNGNKQAQKVIKKMEQLENEILEKGFNITTIKKMQQLKYEFLKLDNALLEQGKDNKRKSRVNVLEYNKRKSKTLLFKKEFYNQIEILNRQSLPLQEFYKKKVQEYFKQN